MPDNAEAVLLTTERGVATITLNRPGRLNAFDQPTVESLNRRIAAAARDTATRTVVLTGAGRAFCAGGDLRAAVDMNPERPSDFFFALASTFHQCVLGIRDMPKPVIAALNGPAAGAGFSLALACDVRVMAESAFLQQAYTSNGLSIDGGGTYTLPRLVGLSRALEIAMLDERIPAARALELGLVNRVEPDEGVMTAALQMAETLASKAVPTLGRVKHLLNRAFDTPLERQLEDERRELVISADSPEGREGLSAFIEKREADYLKASKGG